MLYFNRSTQTSACVLGPAQPRLPPVSESVVRLEVTFHHCRRCHLHHHYHVHHHGRAGGVADPHGEEGSWEHEAKKHLCKKENQKKHLCKKKRKSPLYNIEFGNHARSGSNKEKNPETNSAMQVALLHWNINKDISKDFPTERLLQLKLV